MFKFVPNFFCFLEQERLLDIIFPPVCGICGKTNENWLCENCKRRLEKYCGFELIKIDNKEKEQIYFDEVFYCFEYKKLVRKLLLQYKFNDKSYLANFWARVIMNSKKIDEIFKIYDIMIPVPMDRKKKLERGYNQTELITDIISKKKNILSDKKILVKNKKIRNTKSINL